MPQSGSNNNHIDAHAKLAEAEALVARGQRLRLEAIAELDAPEVWEGDGSRTFAHWVSSRVGISHWIASRLINTAHALPFLPVVDAAFQEARLGIEKVVELARFATPENEARLVKWAERVSPAAIRCKADVESRTEIEDATDPDRDRWARYWWFDAVVVHAEMDALAGDGRGCEIEDCSCPPCRDRATPVVRRPPGSQLAQRDGRCTFPGCESRRFLHAHHVRHWAEGGPIDLWNLVLVCTFHHKLVHERSWKVKLGLPGITHWYRPNGVEYLPNRAPPQLALTG